MTTDAGFCSAMPKEFCGYADDELNRPKWCPLVEIPDKHGRLIDEDDIDIPSLETIHDQVLTYGAIREAPTIIDAEEVDS